MNACQILAVKRGGQVVMIHRFSFPSCYSIIVIPGNTCLSIFSHINYNSHLLTFVLFNIMILLRQKMYTFLSDWLLLLVPVSFLPFFCNNKPSFCFDANDFFCKTKNRRRRKKVVLISPLSYTISIICRKHYLAFFLFPHPHSPARSNPTTKGSL